MYTQVIAPLVSPMTREKIMFVSSGEQSKELLSRIGADQLEARYGGEKQYTFTPLEYFGVDLPPSS